MKKILCLFTVFAAFLTTNVQAQVYGVVGGNYDASVPTKARYTYIFKVHDQEVDRQIVIDGESVHEPASPADMSFEGWRIRGEAANADFPITANIPSTVTEDKNIIVEAQFATVFHATFWKDAEKTAVLQVKSGKTNEMVICDDVTFLYMDGRGIVGWTQDGSSTPLSSVTFTTADVDLIPVLSGVPHAVSFETGEGSPVATVFVIDGHQLTKPTEPSRSGYTFGGWFTDPDCMNAYDFITPVTENFTLYAKWTGTTTNYKVVYWLENANDDNYTIKEVVNKTGTSGTTATYDPKNTEDGKEYQGFTLNTTKTDVTVLIKGDGTTIKNVYYDRKKYTFTVYKTDQTLTFIDQNDFKYQQDTEAWFDQIRQQNSGRAWYTTETGNVAYSTSPAMQPADGGSLTDFTGITVFGRSTTSDIFTISYKDATSFQPIRGNFVGNGGKNAFTDLDKITIPGWTFSHAGTFNNGSGSLFYNRNKYALSFDPQDGTATITVNNVQYEASLAGYVPTTLTSGTTKTFNGIEKTFAGWYDNEECSGLPVDFSGMKMPALSNNGDMLMFYGKWVPAMHTVVFDLNGGTFDGANSIAAVEVESGTTVTEPSGTYAKQDKVFGYWTLNGNRFSFDTRITSDITLVAIWHGDYTVPLTVAYDVNGGTGNFTDNLTYQAGSYAAIQGYPTPPANKVFTGWKVGNSAIIIAGGCFQANTQDAVNGVVTLTAQYGDIPTYPTSVSYSLNGGNISGNTDHISDDNALVNGDYTIKDYAPTLEGFVFKGWSPDANATSAAFMSGDEVASGYYYNILYAVYVPPLTDIAIVKYWSFDDEAPEARPQNLTVGLFTSDTLVQELVMTGTTSEWHDTLRNIPLYNDLNEVIVYEMREKSVNGEWLTKVGEWYNSNYILRDVDYTSPGGFTTLPLFTFENQYYSAELDTTVVLCTNDEDVTAYITHEFITDWETSETDTLWAITLTPEGEVSINTYDLEHIKEQCGGDVTVEGVTNYDSATDMWTLMFKNLDSDDYLWEGDFVYRIQVKTHQQMHDTTVVITNILHDGYTWHDSLYTQPGVHSFFTQKSNGCPLLDILNLEILDIKVSGGDICPGDSTDLLVSVTKMGTPRRVPRPGDVLCTDGTTLHPDSFLLSVKTAMGVVVLADPSEGFGRAVSLSSAYDHLRNDPSMWWATSDCYNSVHSKTTEYYVLDAAMDMDGEGNTDRMLSTAREAGFTNTASSVPAAHNSRYYDHRIYTTGTDSLGWYLPAAGEMRLMHAYRVELNQTLVMLANALQEPLITEIQPQAHWTSTEKQDNQSWEMAQASSLGGVYKYEYNKRWVRPMIKFPLPEGTFSSSAQVGDLMTFPDGSQGIVCYVDPNDNQKGWVVDLYDVEGTHAIWSTHDNIPNEKVPIRNNPPDPRYSDRFNLDIWEQDGKGDTDSLLHAREGSNYSPAADTVHPETGWYIPDAHQLMMLMGMIPVLEPAFERAGVGDIASLHQANKEYWSSTRHSEYSFFFYTNTYNTLLSNQLQWYTKHIRRVRDFDNSNNLQAYWAIQPKEDSIRVSPADTTVYDALVIYNTDTFTVQQTVNVYPTKNTTLYDTVNYAGVPFDTTIRNLTFHVAGIGNDTLNVTLQTHLGCDSIVSVVLTAVKTKLTVTVADTSKTYGDPDPENFGFTVEGLSEGHRFAESVKANRAKVTSGDYATQWLGTEVAGTYVITLKNEDIVVLDASDNNVTDAYDFGTDDFTGTFTINKRPFTITIKDTTVTLMQVDSVVPTYTVTGLVGDFDGDGKKDTVQNNALRFIINNDIAIDTAGVYEIDAELAEGKSEDELVGRNPNVGNSYIPTIIPGKLTITPGTFSITATGYEGKYDGNSHAGTVTVPSDITATLSYSTNGGSTWSSTAPTAKNVADSKTVQVKASAEGYLDATASYDLTVTKRNVTLTSANDEKVYDGTPLTNSTVTVDGDGFANGEGATYNVTGSQTDAGSSANAFTYTLNDGTLAGNYDITKTEGTLTVTNNTTAITLTAGSANKTYDGTALTNSDFTSTGLPAGFTAEVTMTTASTITNAGSQANVIDSYVIKNSAGEDKTAYFTNVTTANGTLTVTKRNVTLTSASGEKVYDGTPLTKNALTDVTVGGDGFVTGEGATYNITGSQTDAGSSPNTFTYTLNSGTSAGNYDITTTTGTLTVNRRPVHVTADNGNKQFGAADPTFTAQVTGTIGTDEITFTITRPRAGIDEAVGTYPGTIVPAGDTQQGNYQVNYINGDFTIAASNEMLLTVTNYSDEYDGHSHSEPATASVTDATITYSTDDGATWSTTIPEIKDVGTITVNAKATHPGYTEKTAIYTLQVTPAPLTITTGSDSKTYDGTPLTKDGVMTGLVNGETATFTVTGSQTNAGTSPNTYSLTWNGTANSNNYTVNETIGTLTVAPKAVTVKAENASKMYGTDDPTFTAQVTGTIGTDEITFTVTRPRAGTDEAVGTYPDAIVPAGATLQGNYTVTYDSADFTITPSDALVLTVYDYDGVYDGQEHGDPATVNVMLGTTITYRREPILSASFIAPKIKDVGTITVTATAENPNYTTKTATYTLKVTPAPLSIITGDSSKTYDGTPLTKDGKMTGLVNGETATFTVTGSQTNAGTSTNTYSLTWDGTAKPSNYAIQELQLGTLSVNPKTIHVRADNKHKKCGGDDPVFTFNIEDLSSPYQHVEDPQGVLENEGITPYIFSYTIDREETEYIGTYDIIPSVKYDGIDDPGNYVFTYDNGKLFVDAKDSTITRTVCENELPYLWEGVLFDSASTKQVQVTAANGCVTLLKMVLSTSQPEYIGDTTVVIVNTDGTTPNGYTWHGTTYTEPGTYAYNLLEGTGCDIDILHLVVLDVDTTIGNICQGGSTEISINVTKRPATATSNLIPRVPQLGDVLCTDGYTMSIDDFIGSGKTAKGVVVQVDAEDGYGRAISLHDTTDLSWVGKSYHYGGVDSYTSTGWWFQAITDMGGDTNTRNMLGVTWNVILLDFEPHYHWWFPTLQQMRDRSPAAFACAYYNGTSPSLSPTDSRDAGWPDWYLPAAGEMMLAFANRTEINKTLAALHNLNSDYQPLSNCDYWTSTKGGTSYRPAWYITSDGNLRHATSTEKKAVRPFIKFQIK